MRVRIVALYNNEPLPNSRFSGSNGLSWFLDFGDQRILFDVGYKGRTLLHNMRQIGIHPDDIDTVVLSHAHIDHTGSLPSLLQARTIETPLTVIAHPSVMERKKAARLLNIGLPKLNSRLSRRVKWVLERNLYQINHYLHTTGEISIRDEKDGTGRIMLHQTDNGWEQDPILDDMSLVLETDEGLVLICGCCHAGLLNTCAHVRGTFGREIVYIMGGTHMRSFSEEELSHVAGVLESEYNTPRMSLGHCTGRKQVRWLQDRFGPEKVINLYAGQEYAFNAQVLISKPYHYASSFD
ncbi:MAG: MBL fold metallo-hydrolase [Candidatus Thorarchaeota archaeon]